MIEQQVKIGVSSCLIGINVRYDGGNRLDRYLTETLGRLVRYVPVCPEVECGLTVPREPMRLEGGHSSPRLVTVDTHIDYTAKMMEWCAMRMTVLEKEGLCGFVFKSRSPSCGIDGIMVYPRTGIPADDGAGIFARAFMERFPLLPVVDEGRFQDPAIRENFIGRVFEFRRRRGSSPGTGAG